MRLRNIPGAKEAIADHPLCFSDETPMAGQWAQVFSNTQPIHLEIGMGKGQFLTTLAETNPQINYIGIELYDSVLIRAVEKLEARETPLPNIRFLRMDARNLTTMFAPGEVARIYLNFSDPWPKDRHAKRRLTSTQFLKRYDVVLAAEGQIEFKTDNQDLFTFSLEQAPAAGWQILAATRDLHHHQTLCAGNVMTEYEERFSAMGNPICKMILMRDSAAM